MTTGWILRGCCEYVDKSLICYQVTVYTLKTWTDERPPSISKSAGDKKKKKTDVCINSYGGRGPKAGSLSTCLSVENSLQF